MLSKISGAKPKIANYHFTTLSPNLGVVRHNDEDFVVADIPGLIEGAANGAGLGIEFLRHIERTRMLVHVVDISGVEGRDPLDDFEKINAELSGYSEQLAKLEQIVVLNKCDVFGADENVKRFVKKYGKKYEIVKASALSGEGVEELLDKVSEKLKTLPPLKPLEFEPFVYAKKDNDSFEVVRDDDGYFAVIGPLVDLFYRNVVLDDQDPLRIFKKLCVKRALFRLFAQRAQKTATP